MYTPQIVRFILIVLLIVATSVLLALPFSTSSLSAPAATTTTTVVAAAAAAKTATTTTTASEPSRLIISSRSSRVRIGAGVAIYALVFGVVAGTTSYSADTRLTSFLDLMVPLLVIVLATAVLIALLFDISMDLRLSWRVFLPFVVMIFLLNIVVPASFSRYLLGVTFFAWRVVHVLIFTILCDVAYQRQKTLSLSFVIFWGLVTIGSAMGITVGQALAVSFGANLYVISGTAIAMTVLLVFSSSFLLTERVWHRESDLAATLLANSRTSAMAIDGSGLSLLADPLPGKCQKVATKYALSERETEVLLLIARGRSRVYIAQALFISENTARGHIRSIYSKSRVHSKQELLDILEAQDHS